MIVGVLKVMYLKDKQINMESKGKLDFMWKSYCGFEGVFCAIFVQMKKAATFQMNVTA
jgi:hypothetical protein